MAADSKTEHDRHKGDAKVDFLVDENGYELDVADDSTVRGTGNVQRSFGATSPSNWWRIGLIALGVVALVILLLQMLNGVPGTDVQPGTPVAAQQDPAPAQ